MGRGERESSRTGSGADTPCPAASVDIKPKRVRIEFNVGRRAVVWKSGKPDRLLADGRYGNYSAPRQIRIRYQIHGRSGTPSTAGSGAPYSALPARRTH